MHLRRIELVDFRIFAAASFVPAGEGTTVITGPNGTGKTSVLEAMVYLGTQRSFRGAPREALVRTGCSRAIVRAELQHDASPQLVEAEVVPGGRSRTQVNRKVARGRRDLAAAAPCTIFSPDDLALISGGPSLRRDLLDDALGLVDPEGARAADEVDRILRQRAALLRQAGGRMNRRRDEHAGRVGPTAGRCGKDPGHRPRAVGQRARAVRRPGLQPSRRYPGSGRGRPALPPQLDGGASRRPGRSSDGRPTARGQYGRTAPGRPGPVPVRQRGADARLAGRATLPGPGRCASGCTSWSWRGPVSPRSSCSTTSSPSWTRPAAGRLVAELPEGQSILTTAAPLPAGIEVAEIVDIAQVARGPMSGRGEAGAAGVDEGPRQVGAAIAKVLARIGAAPSPRDDGARLHPLGGAGGSRARRPICGRCGSRMPPWSSGPTIPPGPPGPGWKPRESWPDLRQLGDTSIERVEVVVQRPS